MESQSMDNMNSHPSGNNAPTNNLQPPFRVAIEGTPTLPQIFTALVAVTTIIVGLVTWYITIRLESTETKINAGFAKTINEVIDPVRSKQAAFTLIAELIISKHKDLTEEEKKIYSGLLSTISPTDMKELLDKQPDHSRQASLDQLEKRNEVEKLNEIKGLNWNGHRAQVRIFKRNNPSLDFSKIELHDDDPDDTCYSKIIELSNFPNFSVQVCETHLDPKLNKDSKSDLELIIIKNYTAE